MSGGHPSWCIRQEPNPDEGPLRAAPAGPGRAELAARRVWTFTLRVNRQPSPAQRRALMPWASVWSVPGPGTARLRFQQRAATLAEAVTRGVWLAERARLRVVRVDTADYVTLQVIADRVGCSRETVRLWTLGRQGPGGFPPPVNDGHYASFYSWAQVLPWLRDSLGLDLPDEEPVLAAVNLLLHLRTLAPRLADDSPVWRLVPSRATGRRPR